MSPSPGGPQRSDRTSTCGAWSSKGPGPEVDEAAAPWPHAGRGVAVAAAARVAALGVRGPVCMADALCLTLFSMWGSISGMSVMVAEDTRWQAASDSPTAPVPAPSCSNQETRRRSAGRKVTVTDDAQRMG